MLHHVYTELLVTERVVSVPLFLILQKCSFLGCACECPSAKLIPTGLLVLSAPHWSVLHILCSWHMSEVSTRTHTLTHTNKYIFTHAQSVLQYWHVSIYTYRCRPGPRRPFRKISLIYSFLFSAPSGKAQSVNGRISPRMNFQPSSSHEYAKNKKKSLMQCAAHALRNVLNPIKFRVFHFFDELFEMIKWQ